MRSPLSQTCATVNGPQPAEQSALFSIPLRKRSDFLRVQKSPLRWVTPGFVLTCEASAPHILPVPAQIGFTITKKIGNAVIRNRIRRRFRHMIADQLPQLDVSGWTIILLARPEALTRAYDDLGKDLRWALRKLKAQTPDVSVAPAAPVPHAS